MGGPQPPLHFLHFGVRCRWCASSAQCALSMLPAPAQLSGGLRPPPRFASLGRLLRAPWPSLVCARVQPALARPAAVSLASAAGRWQCWRQRQRHAHWLQLHRFCCLFQAIACVQCVYSLQTMAGQLTAAGQVGRGGRRRGWQQCRRLRHRPAAASGSACSACRCSSVCGVTISRAWRAEPAAAAACVFSCKKDQRGRLLSRLCLTLRVWPAAA